jgi:hypothetical protein
VGSEHHTPASKRMARSNARCTEFAKSFGKKLFEVKHLQAKTGGQLRSAEVVVNATGDLYDTLDNGDHFGQYARVESRHVNPRFWLGLFVVLQLLRRRGLCNVCVDMNCKHATLGSSRCVLAPIFRLCQHPSCLAPFCPFPLTQLTPNPFRATQMHRNPSL